MATPLMRNFLALSGALTAGRLIRLLYLIAMARLLDPAAIGTYGYGMAFYLSLMVFATFGQNLLVSTRVRSGGIIDRAVLVNSLCLRIIFAVSATVVGLALTWWLERGDASFLTVLVFVFTILPRSAVHMVRDVFTAVERTAWIPRYELAFRGLEAIVGTGLLLAGQGVLAVAVVHAGVYGLEALVSWRRLSHEPGIEVGRRISGRMMRAMAAVSVLFVASIGFITLYGQLPVILLKLSMVDLAPVGQFSIALQVLMTLMILAAMFANALVPAITRVRRRGGGAELRALGSAVKLTLLGGLAIALLAEAFAPLVVPVLFGEPFRPAGDLLALLSWATGPYAAALIVCQSLNALDRRRRAALLALAMNAVLVVLLVPLAVVGGPTAAAGAVIGSSLIGALIGVAALRGPIGADGDGWWWIPIALALACLAGVRTIEAPGPTVPLVALAGAALLVYLSRAITGEEARFVLQRFGVGRQRIR